MADADFTTQTRTQTQAGGHSEAGYKVLRQTYMLLSMTVIFSALTAGISMAVQPPPMTGIVCTIVAFFTLWRLFKVANTPAALGWVFAFTGLLGFSLGPMLNNFLQISQSGSLLIVNALATTGVIFMTLSGYTLISKKDFSFLAGFLSVGLWILIGGLLFTLIAGYFFGVQISGLGLALNSMAVLIFSGFILYDTHRILSGGETNYVLATVSMYLSIYNVFIHLLMIFGFTDD
jgi:modulator of FtsH protease